MPAKTRMTSVASVITIGAVCALTLVGCSGARAQPDEIRTGEPATGESLKIALYSEPQASVVAPHYGVDNYGGDFGLDISVARNVTIHDSKTTFVETARSSNAQVMATSVSAILDARERGENSRSSARR